MHCGGAGGSTLCRQSAENGRYPLHPTPPIHIPLTHISHRFSPIFLKYSSNPYFSPIFTNISHKYSSNPYFSTIFTNISHKYSTICPMNCQKKKRRYTYEFLSIRSCIKECPPISLVLHLVQFRQFSQFDRCSSL